MSSVAMTQTSVSDPLVDLVDAIEEHTHRQQELIESVRALRAFLVPAWTTDGTDPPDSRFITSPPPSLLLAPPVQAPPPVQAAPATEVLGDSTDSPPQLLLRALRRDYDYFTELDEKLALLSVDLSNQDVDDVEEWPGASTN